MCRDGWCPGLDPAGQPAEWGEGHGCAQKRDSSMVSAAGSPGSAGLGVAGCGAAVRSGGDPESAQERRQAGAAEPRTLGGVALSIAPSLCLHTSQGVTPWGGGLLLQPAWGIPSARATVQNSKCTRDAAVHSFQVRRTVHACVAPAPPRLSDTSPQDSSRTSLGDRNSPVLSPSCGTTVSCLVHPWSKQ